VGKGGRAVLNFKTPWLRFRQPSAQFEQGVWLVGEYSGIMAGKLDVRFVPLIAEDEDFGSDPVIEEEDENDRLVAALIANAKKGK